MTTDAKRKFLIDILYFLVIAGIIFLLFKYLLGYLLPFIIGIVVAFLVQKPAKSLSGKTKIPKNIITVFLVVFSYLFILAALVLICFLIYKWLSGLAENLPSIIPVVTKVFDDFSNSATNILNNLPVEFVSVFEKLPQNLFSSLTGGLGTFLSDIATKTATGLPTSIVTTVVTIVASCYIAKDYDFVIKFATNILSKKTWNIILDIREICVTTLFKMLRGYIFLMLLTFVELTVGLWILKVPNFVGVAAIISVVDILPVLGTGTVVIPWSVIALVTGNIWLAVGLLLLYVAVTVIRNFLEPKVIGEQVGLNPIITLFAIFIGFRVLGIVGLFLFPLVLICLYDLYKRGKIFS